MKFSQGFLIFILGSIYSNSININDTFISYSNIIANNLLGNSSSNFPGSSFLNYVLYGITEQRFYYDQFLQSYGFHVYNFLHNNLVIGNDGLLGGICYDSDNVIIPIPGSTIQMIPISLLYKYFPKGYSIFQNTKPFDSCSYQGTISSRINNSTKCNPCSVSLLSFLDSTLFSYSSLFYLNQSPNTTDNFYTDFYGYFNEVNVEMQKGTMKIFFTYTAHSGLTIFDPNSQHLIQFTLDAKNKFYFQGNENIMINGSLANYDFDGFMDPYSQGNLIPQKLF